LKKEFAPTLPPAPALSQFGMLTELKKCTFEATVIGKFLKSRGPKRPLKMMAKKGP
jgi:hypothetical protein